MTAPVTAPGDVVPAEPKRRLGRAAFHLVVSAVSWAWLFAAATGAAVGCFALAEWSGWVYFGWSAVATVPCLALAMFAVREWRKAGQCARRQW